MIANYILIVVFLSSSLLNVLGKALVTVQLQNYVNPSSRDYENNCCETYGVCFLSCDNWFKICITELPMKQTNKCLYYKKTFVYKDNDDITFPYQEAIGPGGLINPLNFTYNDHLTGLGFRIEVWDADSGFLPTQDDLIDKYLEQVSITPSHFNKPTPSYKSHRFRGRRSSLGVAIGAQCARDWYDNKCSTYCVTKNNDKDGHFTCDKFTGDKICNRGWAGPKCLDAICHKNCQLKHASCTQPDGCDCDDGWKHKFNVPRSCSQCIKKLGCKNGYCIDGNDCHCETYWVGDLCDKDNNTCRSSPCLNGARCINDGLDQYKCQCKPGFTGQHCQTEINMCVGAPCKHGACNNYGTRYTCTCLQGFSGPNCTQNIDDCLPDPCQNDAQCQDEIASYKCHCLVGYKGSNCEINIDDCLNNNCQHGSQCIDGVANYTCDCRPGYDGRFCANNIDNCNTQPCKNGGTCVDGINSFKCICPLGRNGRLCGNNSDDCNPNPCNLGKCTDGDNSYNCTCPAGYSGINCEIDIDECSLVKNICNNGVCTDGINSYQCSCDSGYNGTHCDTNIDECENQPCQNSGKCIDGINGFSCQCPAGWEGKMCEQNIDDCIVECRDPTKSKPCFEARCFHGSKCTDKVNGFACNCSKGYEGETCDVRIDYCGRLKPCQNQAQCKNQLETYLCECKPGYADKNCSTNIDECESQPCLNNGTCTDGVNKFLCQCQEGFAGAKCEENINNCDPRDPRNSLDLPEGAVLTAWGFCGRNGQCVDEVNAFSCNCSEGYNGQYCQYDINECLNKPCFNGGSCHQNPSSPGYYCACAPGYDGTNCQNNIDECVTPNEKGVRGNETCCDGQNTCRDAINGFVCRCPQGKVGIDCCSTFTWCDNNNTCHKNGKCSDTTLNGQVVGFACKCEPGWKGDRCQIDINECNANPCRSGAECINSPGNFTCICPAGKTGRNCDTEIDDCVHSKCQNGYPCVDGNDRFHCNCSGAGFTHPLCGDVDECLGNPCPLDRRCVNTVGSYQCVCLEGWTGTNCQASIDDCKDNECTMSHTKECIDKHLSYECQCLDRYEGNHCVERKELAPGENATKDECGCLYGACSLTEDRIEICQCDPGYGGGKCLGPTNEASTEEERKVAIEAPTAVGIAMGGVIGIALIVIFAIYWRRRAPLEIQKYGKKVSYHQKMSIPNERHHFDGDADLMFKNPTFNLELEN